MWDYDKLFADGNIIGIKNCCRDEVFNNVVDVTTSVTWLEGYKNEELACKDQYVDVDDKIKHGYTTDFEIQYIIRLDEHGDVVEKLFDREIDMPKPMPELETGMFALIFNYDHTETRLGYINAEKNIIIYQTGGWDYINENKDDILKVYSNNCNCFDGCSEHRVIWRNQEYQAYFNSKSN